MFQGCSRKFHECFKEVSGKFQGCFKKISRVFQLRLNGVSSSFMGVLMVFEQKFKRCVREVSMVF